MIYAWYHLWDTPEGQRALQEHLTALAESGLDEVAPPLVNTVSEGWEQQTLHKMLDALPDYADDDVVFYSHSKAAANPSDWNVSWRRTMQHFNVDHWRSMYAALTDHDLAGIWWISKAFHPNPHMQGSYWWSTVKYLRALPPLSNEDRWKSELWIGMGQPKVYDAYPGSSGGSPHIGSPDFDCYLCNRSTGESDTALR